MGVNKFLTKAWREDTNHELNRKRLVDWRAEPATLRLEHPTRIEKARAVGYRAKQGIFVVRQRVSRGSHIRPDISGGRRSKNTGSRTILRKNYQMIAEERAAKKYHNCEVLNSYYVAEDGKHYWYEIILVDRAHPAVIADQRIAWIANKHGRVFRGLTSAGRKVRGLRHKGSGTEKARPSRRAHSRRM